MGQLMGILPVSDTTPDCFGICCPCHAQCARYLAIEGKDSSERIGTCDGQGDGKRPMFVKATTQQVPMK